MIDSHAHLYFERFDDDRSTVIERARAAGVDRIINVGIDAATSRAAIALAAEHRGFFATVGLHPTSAVIDLAAEIAAIRDLAVAHRGRVVAIGEIGLDYHWDTVAPSAQRERLAMQLDLAAELALPVVFHCRDALADLFAALEARPDRPAGVFHCFGGAPAEAERALALGFHVSFAGNVTFPKADELRAAASVVPIDRLLLETDCPFLAPQARRGQRGEPAFVAFTRDALAELHGVTPAELEREATRATERLFGLPG